jgi:3-methylfumaryl-CoA hydratase
MTGSVSLADALTDWRPGEVEVTERLDPAPANAFAALLDQPAVIAEENDPLPPLWHWFYFLDWPEQRRLGADGHPTVGPFLPPIPERRRMFAGARLQFHEPLRCGAVASRRSRVIRSEIKDGRSGSLCFVTVRHEFRNDGRLLITEEQDLVYRSGTVAPPGPRTPASGGATAPLVEPTSPWRLRLEAEPLLLFRFSALTRNAHRIHYDLPYARDAEGFPGLVVHGPLLALMLLELSRRQVPDRPVRAFRFRAERPVFAGDPVWVHGDPSSGRHAAERDPSAPAMTAQLEWAERSSGE